MAAWARLPTSFSSLPTTSSSSSSSPSSSASLPPLVSLDLFDDLWFYRSVLPLPSIGLPCFQEFASPFLSPPPDSSTLIAQCMYGAILSSSSSSSSSPLPPADPEQTQYPSWYRPAPGEDADHKENGYLAYNHGYSRSESDEEDESYYRNYYRNYARPTTGEDEEAYHYYTAASDWDDEDAFNGYPAPSDCEDEQPSHLIQEDQLRAMYPHKPHADLEPDDALSGIYDVAVLLKDQHYEEIKEVRKKHLTLPSSLLHQEAVSQVSALPHLKVSSGNDQADMKENLKLWAHAVALTLPWKAAAQARPFL